MGVTGLLYAAIVVVWAIFLVPMALRRHDQVARNRSIERFSSAMRVLSRTGSGSSPASSPGLVTPPQARPSQPSMKASAARRRRVLAVLVAAVGVVGACSAFAVIPWWSLAAPVALILGFLWLARRQVRLATDAYWAEARPGTANVVRRSANRVDASHGEPRDDSDDEPTVTLTAAEVKAAAAVGLAEERFVAVSMTTADGGSLWDPLPVTLPMYVDKPVAKRTIRTIELGEPGTWSSGHSAEASQAAAQADEGLDTEGQRAANA